MSTSTIDTTIDVPAWKITSVTDQLEKVTVEDGASDDDGYEDEQPDNPTIKPSKKKKKRKPKKVKKLNTEIAENGGGVPPETVIPLIEETPEQKLFWEKELEKDSPTYELTPYSLLDDSSKRPLEVFHTPSCRSFELRTPRLRLRMVQPGDVVVMRKIKTEPLVQKTQMYGAPSPLLIRPMFASRYIYTSIPRLSGVLEESSPLSKNEYVFAITVKDPTSIKLSPQSQVRLTNRITSTEGYLGNIGIKLEEQEPNPEFTLPFSPKTGEPYYQPTFGDCEKAKIIGMMYYEIHPQVWGQGIVTEAFKEVLRFGIEELGCMKVTVNPTPNNEASIKLCLNNGMRFVETIKTGSKPQLLYEISREVWFDRNRPGKGVVDPWGGKELCRWCMNIRLAPPRIQCSGCSWARYCSRECQRADWALEGGHQDECGTGDGLSE